MENRTLFCSAIRLLAKKKLQYSKMALVSPTRIKKNSNLNSVLKGAQKMSKTNIFAVMASQA
jgi:hypothetical protein